MKRLLLMITALVSILAPTFVATSVFAADTAAKDAICQGIGYAGGSTDCSESKDGISVQGLVKKIIDILSLLVGIVAVIMIIIGGFKYIISSGDSANISSAKNTILYAIIGLVIVAFAQLIVKFVINKVTV